MRVIMALRETGIQLILATIITVGAGISAWILAATAFAQPPRLAVPPGIIGVAVQASNLTARAPIDVDALYTPTSDQASGTYELSFTQVVSESASSNPPPTVIVFLCGPIGLHPDFTNAYFHPVSWRVPSSPNAGSWSSVFGFLSQCIYTALPMHGSGTPFRQALIQGSFGTATSDVSGTKVLYALPGIDSWFMPVPINGLNPTAMPRGSTVSVQLNRDPGDFTNMFASPQLPNAGSLTWTGVLGGAALPIREYRVEADSQEAVSQLQLHLFLSGVLVGVGGGAFVWLVQVACQAGYGAIAASAERTTPEGSKEADSRTPDQEAPELAALKRTPPDGAGLGWPT